MSPEQMADRVEEREKSANPAALSNTASSTVAVATAATALAWVAVALVHPTSFTGVDNDTWTMVHIAQLAFAPMVALGLLAVLRGLPGPMAALGRVAAVLWAAWFAGFDAVAGVATGILAGGDAATSGLYLYEHVLVQVMGWVAPALWLLAALAAGIALRRSGAPTITYTAVLVSTLIFVHAGLPAAIGFAALATAFWTGIRVRTPVDRRW